MMFWKRKRKKKKDDLVIQCPKCEWQPEGKELWQCSCGHHWHTFDTKGKCPKCKRTWEDTRCPACGAMPTHESWYKTHEEIYLLENSGDLRLKSIKKSLESKLIKYGIKRYRVSHLPTLDHKNEEFQTPYETGCRLLCIYAVSQAANEPENRIQILKWLQAENLWDKTSPNEQSFLNDAAPSKKAAIEFSWAIESAITLAWCLGKVSALPPLDNSEDETPFEVFFEIIPKPGESTQEFLSQLSYISLDLVYEENLLNQTATAYFRDLIFNGQEDETQIDRYVSYGRHKALNWLRKCYNESDELPTGKFWDETDTST